MFDYAIKNLVCSLVLEILVCSVSVFQTNDVRNCDWSASGREKVLEERPSLWVHSQTLQEPRRNMEPDELGVWHSGQEGNSMGGGSLPTTDDIQR